MSLERKCVLVRKYRYIRWTLKKERVVALTIPNFELSTLVLRPVENGNTLSKTICYNLCHSIKVQTLLHCRICVIALFASLPQKLSLSLEKPFLTNPFLDVNPIFSWLAPTNSDCYNGNQQQVLCVTYNHDAMPWHSPKQSKLPSSRLTLISGVGSTWVYYILWSAIDDDSGIIVLFYQCLILS